MLRQPALALLIPALVAGCADLRWHRFDANAAAVDQDLAACRRTARLHAYREAWPLALANRQLLGFDLRGRPLAPYPYRFETDRFLREHDLANACMRGKGYDLVPVSQDRDR